MNIFVSSTFEDLREERAAVERVIDRLHEVYVGMERFGSDATRPLAVCLEQVRNATYVILLVGSRRGSIAPGQERSFTELEYLEARAHNIPVLPYQKHRDETDPPREPLLQAFLRDEVYRDLTAA